MSLKAQQAEHHSKPGELHGMGPGELHGMGPLGTWGFHSYFIGCPSG